ncbi:tenascin-R-like [Orbicella faveolata]|uniref:tenascin-R-like n=1 Tax=Orbicella faveolata TaxID=48498 RepID=UPI0009E5B184|nr:tenascin-R-like [Orbicella faveolata]
MSYHNGMMFSTKEQDNDFHGSEFCAQRFTAAWWYNKCHYSHLNGQYGDSAHGKGINWKTWRGHEYSLKESVMKVKPLRERDWSYELIFSGESFDVILLPRITDLKDFTACWWLKTELPTGWSTIFSFQNNENESLVSFSFHENGSYSFHIHNDQR